MRKRSLALVAAFLVLAPSFAFVRAEDKDTRQNASPSESDEEFARRLVELILKTVEESSKEVLDQTPVSAFEGNDRDAAQQIYRTLDGSRISLNFDGSSFDETLDFFRDVTGLNVS